MVAALAALPASKYQLESYQQSQEQDLVCAQVRDYCRTGWPSKHAIQPDLAPFWNARASLTLDNNLLLHGQRIVVPPSLQLETLEKLHDGHQGVERCK